MDGVGEVNGVPLFEYDVDAHDKPWKLPGTKITIFVLRLYHNFLYIVGADITDYFNYGFTEETWKLYCERQRQMKSEVGQLNKTVSGSTSAHQLVGPCTNCHTNRQLVPSYKISINDSDSNIRCSALITVLMLNDIISIFLLIIIIATLVWHYLG